MAGRSLRDDLEDGFNPEINTTPLVDVMLVLLVVFIITMPALQHAVKVELPRVSSAQIQAKPATVDVAIDAGGVIHWNDRSVDVATLEQLAADAAQHDPQTELHLRADRRTPYEEVMQVMAAAQHGGLSRIGFVSDENAH
ncbi:Biopolymer transport protein exbD1 [Paraburkholderia tropica]|uniref:ExbD/TolR family protein n=1 Tax=Paraburkholderia TaxID=1822464 RepID=UPI001CB10861|nr:MULTISPECIES: biopolymer transporter ExbD [Paraburkholderia]CAG9238820.1 Biopolymer transport protein exbD1 [Paraburkholderia tropica]